MLRRAGASSVHMRISSPPTAHPCFYGIATPQRAELLAARFDIEGMAEYLSLGPIDPNTAMWLRDAVRHNKIPSIRQLEDPRYFRYRWGQAFWAYLTSRYGDGAVATLLKSAGKSGNVTVALEHMSGVKLDSLSHLWQQAVRDAYTPVEGATETPQSFGRALASEKSAAQLNVAPALSPDGSRIAFFSERGLFSIELYLADVASGRVERTLTHTALDSHYESVGFISSAGAWDATGRRFVFGVVEHGRPLLSILDVSSGKPEREIPFPSLGEIFNTTWSPDGNAVAFSAQVNGWTDLYVYDLQRNVLRRLTNDLYADLQPAWSPDGRSLAFVTDRFTTDTADLAAGPYRLALLDLASGAIPAATVPIPAALTNSLRVNPFLPAFVIPSPPSSFVEKRTRPPPKMRGRRLPNVRGTRMGTGDNITSLCRVRPTGNAVPETRDRPLFGLFAAHSWFRMSRCTFHCSRSRPSSTWSGPSSTCITS